MKNNPDIVTSEEKAIAIISYAMANGRRGPTNEEFVLYGAAKHLHSVRPLLDLLEDQGRIVISGVGRNRCIKLVEPATKRAGKRINSGFDQETLDAMVIVACRAAGVENPVIPGRSNV